MVTHLRQALDVLWGACFVAQRRPQRPLQQPQTEQDAARPKRVRQDDLTIITLWKVPRFASRAVEADWTSAASAPACWKSCERIQRCEEKSSQEDVPHIDHRALDLAP